MVLAGLFFLSFVDNGRLKGVNKMMWVWVLIVIGAIFLLLALFMLLRLNIIIDYYHGNHNDHLKITFKTLFGLIKYKINIPVIKVAEDSPSLIVEEKIEAGPKEKDKQQDTKKFTAEEMLQSFQDMQMLLKHVAGFYKIIRSFLRKVTVSNFEWNSRIGVGDASYTGMLTGAFWAVKGSIIGLVSSFMNVKTNPIIMITPEFNRALAETSFRCMIHFRIGHAIFVGIKLIKYWKGGRPRFKTKPLSILSNKAKSV